MSTNIDKAQDRQLSTLPPVIRKEKDGKALLIYRIKNDNIETYDLVSGDEILYKFSAWQYHALCALFSFGGEDYAMLLGNVNDRFGSSLKAADIRALFTDLKEKELFNIEEAEKHPLTKGVLSGEEVREKDQPQKPEAVEEKQVRKTKFLFNPTQFLKSAKPVLLMGQYLLYPLPLLVFAALLVLWNYAPAASQDVSVVRSSLNIIGAVILGMFSINALTVFTVAVVAYCYGATVNSVSLTWYYGFIPRFTTAYEDTEKFSRRQKLWFHAAPLLTRLGFFSICVLLWHHGRPLQGALPHFFATMALMAGFSILLTSCPLYRGSGYAWLAEFLGEPRLREKAFLALLNKYKKNVYAKIDSDLLAGYSLACILFLISLSATVLLLLHSLLRVEVGSKSLVAVLVLGGFMIFKIRRKFAEIGEAYEKRQQYERWRQRSIPQNAAAADEHGLAKMKAAWSGTSLSKRLLVATAILALICPYPYRASGRVMLMPVAQQQISSDIAGIVDEVFVDGGEVLEEGAVIARLSVKDQQAQLEIAQGKMAEQQAYIEQLRAMPSAEDIALAAERLEVARVQSGYSDAQCGRQKILYDAGAISLDAFESVQKLCDVDRQKTREAEAELAKVMAGASPEQIATAESALQTIQAQITLYEDQIERSTLRMPFDGTLAALNLQEKKGDFLERGVPLAVAENNGAFKIALEVPEADAPYIATGASVEIRLTAHPGEVFKGVVEAIDSNVENKDYGKTVKVIATLENDANALKSGMTGYAKVNGESLMVWQVLTRAVYRFITVEMWAWVP